MGLPNKTNLLPDRPGIPPMAAMPEAETVDPAALAKAYADGAIDLVCVLGPTASGKSRYAVQLARAMSEAMGDGMKDSMGADMEAHRFSVAFLSRSDATENLCASKHAPTPRAEILSADSRQVYRGMDIGTGKDLGEYGEVPYHLIDIVPAGSKFNIYEYQAAFADAYADVRSRG